MMTLNQNILRNVLKERNRRRTSSTKTNNSFLTCQSVETFVDKKAGRKDKGEVKAYAAHFSMEGGALELG